MIALADLKSFFQPETSISYMLSNAIVYSVISASQRQEAYRLHNSAYSPYWLADINAISIKKYLFSQ